MTQELYWQENCPNYDSRVVIYTRKMLIRLTTACNTKIKLPASQITFLDSEVKKDYTGAVVVVKWSACSPSFPTIRVRILLMSTEFSVNFVFDKNKNIQKEAGVGPFKKEILPNAFRSTKASYFRNSLSREFFYCCQHSQCDQMLE